MYIFFLKINKLLTFPRVGIYVFTVFTSLVCPLFSSFYLLFTIHISFNEDYYGPKSLPTVQIHKIPNIRVLWQPSLLTVEFYLSYREI